MALLERMMVLVLVCVSYTSKGAEADLVCEHLPANLCAFSVCSHGTRCVLEGDPSHPDYKCQDSGVLVREEEYRIPWIETDDCIRACGLSRMSKGLSTDALSNPTTLAKLCSHDCKHSCPSLFHLYDELAGEADHGSTMDKLCMQNYHKQDGGGHVDCHRRYKGQFRFGFDPKCDFPGGVVLPPIFPPVSSPIGTSL